MHKALIYDEQELLLRVSEGDRAAFEQIFYQWHNELGAYILNIIKDTPLAQDIVQDVFIKVWNHRAEVTAITNLRSWLFRVGRNHTYNLLRDRARKGELEKNWNAYQQSIGVPTNDADIYSGIIDKAISQLSPQRKKVYLMSRRDGLRQKEIADRLDISVETVKKHIMAATREIIDQLRNARGLPATTLLLTLTVIFPN